MTDTTGFGMLDRLRDLRIKRKRLAELTWSANIGAVRWFSNDGQRTHEHDVDGDLIKAAQSAPCEYHGGKVSYNALEVIGNTAKSIVLRYLDKQIVELSKLAKDEAEAVLELCNKL